MIWKRKRYCSAALEENGLTPAPKAVRAEAVDNVRGHILLHDPGVIFFELSCKVSGNICPGEPKAGTGKAGMAVLPDGTKARNCGCYTLSGGVKWLYIPMVWWARSSGFLRSKEEQAKRAVA